MGVIMHGGAKADRRGQRREQLLWKEELVGHIIIRRATLDAANRGRELFKATGFLLLTPAHTYVTKLGIRPISVTAEHLGGETYDWCCDRMADYVTAKAHGDVVWIA